MSSYRDAVSHREISSILSTSSESSDNIVWQNIDDVRHVFSVIDYQYDQSKMNITVHESKDFHPVAGIPLYGKLVCKQSVFKTEIIEVSEGLIQVERPNLMKAVELRGGPRFKFDKNEDKRVKLVFGSKDTAFTSISVKAEDISIKGLGVQVDIVDNSLDYVGKQILLSALGGKALDEPIECELMYTKRYKGVVNNEVVERARIGLRLKEQLSQGDIETFVENA